METEIKISNVYGVESAWDEVLSNEDIFEEDQSGFEFASTSIEYIETADGYYPLHADPEIATEDVARLSLNAEQDEAAQVALAGGTATVEILTPFGTETTEVWSIQTFTASGEGCFVLTATTEKRDIVPVEQDNEDASISIVEMAYDDSDSGGDMVISVPLERYMDTNSEPVLIEVIIDDDITREEIVAEEIIINTSPMVAAETQTTQYQLKDEPTEQIVKAIDVSAETEKPKESVDDGEEIEREVPHIEDFPILASEKSEQGQWSEVSKEPIVLELAESMPPEVLNHETDIEEYEVELDSLTEEYESVVGENSAAETVSASSLVETTLPDIKTDTQQSAKHFHTEEPHIIIHDVEQKPRSVNVQFEQEIVVATVPTIVEQETLHQVAETTVETTNSTTDYEEVKRSYSDVAVSETVETDRSVHRVEIDESNAPRPTREVHVRPLSSWEAFDFEPTYDTKPARRLFDAVDDDIVISFETSRRKMARRQASLTHRRAV